MRVAETGKSLAAAWSFQVPPANSDLILTVALADSTASHGLTVTWLGAERGESEARVDLPGDELVLPLHGVATVTIESDAYPTVITYGILPAGASVHSGLSRAT